MSSADSQYELGVEIPGKTHVTGKKPPKEGPFLLSKNSDPGLPLDTVHFNSLEELANDYRDTIANSYSPGKGNWDRDFLESVADRLNQDLGFTFQGSGIATLSKQVDTFLSIQETGSNTTLEKERLAKSLDCKLVTIVTGLTIGKLAQQQEVPARVEVGLRFRNDAHPRLLIEVGNQEERKKFTISWRVPEGNLSQASVTPIFERFTDKTEKDYSIRFDLYNSTYPPASEAILENLRTLDENFLR